METLLHQASNVEDTEQEEVQMEHSKKDNTDEGDQEGQLQLHSAIKSIDQGNITSAKFHRLTDQLHHGLMKMCLSHGTELAVKMLQKESNGLVYQGKLSIGFAFWVNGLTTIYNAVVASVRKAKVNSWRLFKHSLESLDNRLKHCEFEGKQIVEGDLYKVRYMQLSRENAQMGKAEEYSRRGVQRIHDCEISAWTTGIKHAYLNYQWQNIRRVFSPDDLFEELADEFINCYHYLLIAREVFTMARFECVIILECALQAKLKLPCDISGHKLVLYLDDYRLSPRQVEEAGNILCQTKRNYFKHLSNAGVPQYKVREVVLELLESILHIRAAQQRLSSKKQVESYELLLASEDVIRRVSLHGSLGQFSADCPEVLLNYIESMQNQLPHSKLILGAQNEPKGQKSPLSPESSGDLSFSSESQSVESDTHV